MQKLNTQLSCEKKNASNLSNVPENTDFLATSNKRSFRNSRKNQDSGAKVTVKKLTPSALKEIELKNHARKLAGLSPIKIVTRKCINCGKIFESSGNRSCGCQSRRSGFIAGREII